MVNNKHIDKFEFLKHLNKYLFNTFLKRIKKIFINIHHYVVLVTYWIPVLIIIQKLITYSTLIHFVSFQLRNLKIVF